MLANNMNDETDSKIKWLFKKGLRRSLFFWFLVFSLLPLGIVGWISAEQAHVSIQQNKIEQLSSIAKLKSLSIKSYFGEIESKLRLQAKLSNTVDFANELSIAFSASGKSVDVFTKSFRWALISDNYAEDLKRFMRSYGYLDAFVIDPQGNILFSVRQDQDLGTNIADDKTKFTSAYLKAMQFGQTTFSDIAHYMPYDDQIAGFMFQVILNEEGEKIGVLAIHISMDPINNIMQDHTGLGETGETYIVGTDFLMRSNSRFFEEGSTILKQKVETVQAKLWLSESDSPNKIEIIQKLEERSLPKKMISNNLKTFLASDQKATRIYLDYRNVEVLGAREPLNIGGISLVMLAEIDTTEVFSPAEFLVKIIYAFVSITAFFVLIVAFFITRKIVGPITSLSSWAREVADGNLQTRDLKIPDNEIGILNLSFVRVVHSYQTITAVTKGIAVGDLSQTVDVRGEKDELSHAINQMIVNIQETVEQANTIAQGDYSLTIEPRGPHDELSIALNKMMINLRTVYAENEQTQWLAAGQNRMSECMRGDQNMDNLARNVITELAKFLGAVVGAIYIVNENKKLKLTGTYAYTIRKSIENEIEFGEGIVGQAALENQHIILTDVPPEYMQLKSGLGASAPRSIIVVPFVYENDVKGVFELGFMKQFDEEYVNFIQLVAEHVGIGFNSAESRSQLSQVLEQTRQQASELQTQQEQLKTSNQELEEYSQILKKSEEELKIQSEELRTTNEGLSEQTESLRKSQEELKVQSEELQASNEELEEKSEYLVAQKNEIEKKNEDINISKLELEKRAEDLSRASKYKSEFLSNMSHELRTPLNSLLILAQNLAENEDGNLNADQIESASIIQSSGYDLLTLINDILDLSKIEAGKMTVNIEDFSLNDLLVDLTRQFQHVADDRQLTFTIVQDQSLPDLLNTDVQRIKQILRNLLSNAFKFTSQGSVTLSVHGVDSQQAFNISTLTVDKCIAFSVTDSGIGIPEDKLDTIFGAFQQADGSTSREYGGTGLGLAISSAFAQLLGGELSVKSGYGEGSTFTVYLPSKIVIAETGDAISQVVVNQATAISQSINTQQIVANDPEKNINPIIQNVSNELLSTAPPIKTFILDDRDELLKSDQCILIIEDDKVFAKILMGLAHRRRYKCVVAGDGRSGMLLAHNINPMAILLDLGLPDIDGLEVLDYLKSNLEIRHIPVHILSGREDEIAAMQKGAMGFVPKPASADVITEVFSKIETLSDKSIKDLLIVDDDENTRISLRKLLDNINTRITTASTGNEAFKLIVDQHFDCIVLDIRLPDINGDELLLKLENELNKNIPPIVVFTGKDLSVQEYDSLQKHTSSIVVKGAESMERVLDETTLFLHSLESKMPEQQKTIIQMMHKPDQELENRIVLLVDDDLRNTFALSKVLKKHGLEVIIADNGQLALDKLAEENGIDIVLMDIMMPIMDGYEAMKKIRALPKFAHLPIIALTANAMPEDRSACLASGASDYLTKPLDKDKLLALMRVWLSGAQSQASNF